MKYLNDDELLQAYETAVQLKLDEEFIRLLVEEMTKRGMSPPDPAPPGRLEERIAAYSYVAV